MVEAAGGNYSTLATTGGVVAVHIQWKCNLDFDFLKNCLPEYVRSSVCSRYCGVRKQDMGSSALNVRWEQVFSQLL